MRRCALLASRSPRPLTRRSARRSRRSSPGSAAGCTSAPRRSRSRPASCSSRSRRRPRPASARACTSSRRCSSSPSRPSTTAAAGRRGRTASCKRFDHANIFLLIAGTYTPFALLLLEGAQRTVLLSGHLVGGRARRAVQGVLDRLAALALPADLHRHGLGGGVLHPRLRRGLARPARRRHRHGRPGAGRSPAALSTRSAASSTASSVPTRGRAGSASTRSSTRFTILAFVTHYVGVSMATYALR